MRFLQRTRARVAAAISGVLVLGLVATACVLSGPATEEAGAVTGESSFANRSSVGLWIPDVVESVTPSIVQVSVRTADGSGSGTGIVFDEEGTIITNWHVVQNANEVEVVLPSEIRLPATLMREDINLDLAVLTVDADGLVPAEFGDSGNLRVGEDVVSIGHAFGLSGGPSVSRGVVSALNRTVVGTDGVVFEDLIQTDAAINLGSSGGALINSSGEVIGINIGSLSIGNGANFALDINTGPRWHQPIGGVRREGRSRLSRRWRSGCDATSGISTGSAGQRRFRRSLCGPGVSRRRRVRNR